MKVVQDVVYDPAYAPATVGDLYLPDTVTADTQLVLNIHGGGWSSLDRSRTVGISEFLVENNCIVYNIDYRLTTQSPWPACGDDCLKAADFLLNGDIPELAGVDTHTPVVLIRKDNYGIDRLLNKHLDAASIAHIQQQVLAGHRGMKFY